MNELVKSVLKDLETASESVQAFADDLWRGINYHDLAAVEDGVRLYAAYGALVQRFQEIATQVTALIEPIGNGAGPITLSARASRAPARDFTSQRAHPLTESFTAKVPVGFQLQARTPVGVANWTDWYAEICRELSTLNPARFDALPENPAFVTPYDNKRFLRDAADHGRSRLIARGIHAQVGMSANALRDMVKRLFVEFGVRPGDLKTYLLERT